MSNQHCPNLCDYGYTLSNLLKVSKLPPQSTNTDAVLILILGEAAHILIPPNLRRKRWVLSMRLHKELVSKEV
ncbi:MAG: hypothetical protein RMY16_05450 [Nostoc sp. DedQUE12b]|uniref:hypothetical protein n=1 Tax=Nostoc sp. DedQUE12b TaxID=3075398 RepID=UPI002AD4425D|nr:hypothetical protein [Nostoc sp. DedQUE12b]MDZ8085033.1 hypothetical protein [Nostoc sp. DedQUE12b]